MVRGYGREMVRGYGREMVHTSRLQVRTQLMLEVMLTQSPLSTAEDACSVEIPREAFLFDTMLKLTDIGRTILTYISNSFVIFDREFSTALYSMIILIFV